MAVALMLEFEGFTADEYDAVNAKVNPPGNPPAGLIFHSSGPSPEGGWRIVDVWESRDQFDQFMAQTVQPAMAEVVGAEEAERRGPPAITEWSVHNFTKP
jgi:hypothetical protein